MPATSRTYLMLGKCLRTTVDQMTKVSVPRLEMDKNLKMLFRESKDYFAHDPKGQCQAGDMVLIKELPEPMSLKIAHRVEKVVYKLGCMIDPVTGKQCMADRFVADIVQKHSTFGGEYRYTHDNEAVAPTAKE